MLLTIYDSRGIKKAELNAGDNSTQVKELQGDNMLTLSFTLYDYLVLDVNDYTDYEGERYWLMEAYQPNQKSTVEWNYDLKLYGIESLIKRFLVLKTVDGVNEPVFTLTAPPSEHVAMIVKCINDGMNNTTNWKMGTVEGTENIVVDYQGTYCDEGLREIAKAVGTECWIEGQTVNICRCEHGEELIIGYGNGITEIEKDTADNVKFYTRLFPIGSSRNIDVAKYGYSRLQLPDKLKYVDTNVEKYGIIHQYEADAFAGIYPRRVGVVSSVRSEDVNGEDGTPFTIYYFKDDSLNFDPNDYEIRGLVKRVSFQNGELAGIGEEDNGTYYLECNYNSNTREFELITIWTYDDDTQLPGGVLIPKTGDKYILWNISMPDVYYTLAEIEFQEAVLKYNKENSIDISVYKCPTDHVWIEKNRVELFIGRRVCLLSDKYFPETGKRSSRITKITRNVNIPGQADLEISDALGTGVMSKLNNDIKDAKSYSKGLVSGIAFPDIIRSWDNTQPTDNNIFSSRRSLKEFASKLKEDTFQKKMRFLEGLNIGDFVQGESGGCVDGEGNTELLSLVIRNLMRSTKFVDGFTGEGFQMWMNDLNGLSHLTVDKLTIRQTMNVLELLVQKARSIGGQFIVSAANGKIKEVKIVGGNYVIEFEQDNTFMSGDLMRCAVMSGTEQHSYWVEIKSADTSSVVVDISQFEGVEPKAGDEVVLMGNTTNRLRQNLISIAATEDGQPRIDVLDGISSKTFKDSLRVRLGNLDGIRDDRFPLDNQPRGNGLYGDNVYLVGSFMLTTGEDILTKFNVIEGRIEAAIEGLRTDFTADKSYLNNASFGDGLNKWDTENEATFFLLGDRWIWTNNSVLSNKTNYASVKTDEGRTTVFIRNKYILQKNGNFRSIPEYKDINSDGEKIPEAVYLSFFYKCTKAGRLQVTFENTDKTGFENFNMFSIDKEIVETVGYITFNHAGLWNGTGDFKLSFSGDIYLYMLVLSTDKTEALSYKYKSLFEMSEKLIKLSTQNFDQDGNVLEESSITQTVSQVSLKVKKDITDGLSSTGIDIESGEVTVIADKVKFTDNEGNEQALLNNGKLNIDAIDVDNIEAQRVVVKHADNPKQRVEILPEAQGMLVYNEDGEVCQEFTGQTKTNGVSDFFGEGVSGTLTMSNAFGTYQRIATDAWSEEEGIERVLSNVFYSPTPATVKLLSGKIDVYAYATGFTYNTGDAIMLSSGYAYGSVVLQESNSAAFTTIVRAQTIANVTVSANATPNTIESNTYDSNEARKSIELTGASKKTFGGGYFRLVFKASVDVHGTGSQGSIKWGSSASNGIDIAAEWRSDNYVSYFFANGFCLGTRSDDYFLAFRDEDGMNVEYRNPNIGFRMIQGGIQTLVGGGNWMPMPMFIFKAIYSFSSNAYTASQVMSFNNIAPAATRLSTGKVQLTLPTSWVNGLGSRLTAERLLVHVYGYSDVIKATIIAIASTYITIGLSDDDSFNDANFIIDIQLL